MPLDELLRWVDACGLTLSLVDGAPRLKGPTDRMTPDLVAALKLRRLEIVEWLADSLLPRRVVIVATRFGPPTKVLAREAAAGFIEKVREHAKANPAYIVAGEWLHEFGFRREWRRFIWIDHDHSITQPEGVLCGTR